MNEQKLKLWAVVELFGHNKLAGMVTEQNVGSSSFVRVDVPETEQSPAFTRLLNPSAIYAINPVTEEVARYKVAQFQVQPIESWDTGERAYNAYYVRWADGRLGYPNESDFQPCS